MTSRYVTIVGLDQHSIELTESDLDNIAGWCRHLHRDANLVVFGDGDGDLFPIEAFARVPSAAEQIAREQFRDYIRAGAMRPSTDVVAVVFVGREISGRDAH